MTLFGISFGLLVCIRYEVHSTYLMLKFGLSEKGAKFEKIFHFQFDVTHYGQILSRRFFSNFVPFSEGSNFTVAAHLKAMALS